MDTSIKNLSPQDLRIGNFITLNDGQDEIIIIVNQLVLDEPDLPENQFWTWTYPIPLTPTLLKLAGFLPPINRQHGQSALSLYPITVVKKSNSWFYAYKNSGILNKFDGYLHTLQTVYYGASGDELPPPFKKFHSIKAKHQLQNHQD
jgi:hypothetical protein